MSNDVPIATRGLRARSRSNATGLAALGMLSAFAAYMGYVMWYEAVVMPTLVPPGAATLSYGQMLFFVSLPLMAILGIAAGTSLYLAITNRRMAALCVPIVVGGLVALAIAGLWRAGLAAYGPDPSDHVVYTPLLWGSAAVAVLGVAMPLWSVALSSIDPPHDAQG